MIEYKYKKEVNGAFISQHALPMDLKQRKTLLINPTNMVQYTLFAP